MSSSKQISRRQLLKRFAIGGAAAGGVAGGLSYSLNRGIRYPMLGLEPKPLGTLFSLANGSASLSSNDLLELPQQAGKASENHSNPTHHFRTFSAEPNIKVRSNDRQRIQLSVNNLSTDAVLEVDTSGVVSDTLVAETIDGITRTVELNMARAQEATLSWALPYSSDFKFASIGDSGGDHELAWCIQRAHDLGAKFLLHLGDFNYQEGDYERSIALFHNSPIPCYISIGNHDFHDSGVIYTRFLDQLGPLNHAFTIGKTRFVNIDTAASMLPYSAGNRGALLESLTKTNNTVTETVSYTHCPLHDPLEGSTHDIGSKGERDWLIKALNRIESKTLLSGHIHIYDRSEFMGIDNIIAGQGLGHQDILTNSDYSKMVIGEVATDGTVNFKPEPLSMPMGLHCHPRSQAAKDSVVQHHDTPQNRALLDRIETQCDSITPKT